MAIREILKWGNPQLLRKSEDIDDIFSQETKDIINDLKETAFSLGERVGLAAPQIGITKRILIFRVPLSPLNKRYSLITNEKMPEIPWTILINPTYSSHSHEKQKGWEGCASVPGILGEVERYKRITYTATDEYGHFISYEASDFHARLIQHEIDHLEGILFPMRLTSPSRIGFEAVILGHSSA